MPRRKPKPRISPYEYIEQDYSNVFDRITPPGIILAGDGFEHKKREDAKRTVVLGKRHKDMGELIAHGIHSEELSSKQSVGIERSMGGGKERK